MNDAAKSARQKVMSVLKSRKMVYERLFNSPDGQIVLADLQKEFGGSTLKKIKDGSVDPHASWVATGAREVLLYISQMRKQNELD